MRIKLIVSLLFVALSAIAADVVLSWNGNPAATGYKIYSGTNSRIYQTSNDVGSVNTVTFTGITAPTTYFAATAYDGKGYETYPSIEAIFQGTGNGSIVNYIGMKVDYGTNLVNLQSKSICVLSIDSSYQNFYAAKFVMTNRPFVGVRPNDTNNYLYLGEQIQFGTGLTDLKTVSYDLMTFTNPPPNQFYKGSLIITNKFF